MSLNPIFLLLAALVGGLLGYLASRKEQQSAEELLLKAKESALNLTVEAQKQIDGRQADLHTRERALDQRATQFDEESKRLDTLRTTLREEAQKLELANEARTAELERIAGLTSAAAKAEIIEAIASDAREAAESRLKKINAESDETREIQARKILSLAIERYSRSHVAEACTTYVEVPAEDYKGRIIGREGRNIKVLEHLTGCDFVIDDTPGLITVTGFSPVRRQVAKRALENLLKDGRIQPARIEEAIKQAKDDLSKEMKKAGEDALNELGIPLSSIDPKLIAILGRLKFRTSYGQNVLEHSIEVAKVASMLGEELGLDVFALKKGGLFHDIGKAVDHDMQGAHPQIGYNIMKKFGWPEELCYQSIAHHEDRPRTVEGVIVKAADAISGARPGARRNNIEEYIQRLQNLERVATSFPGVDKAYAIQAGREIRVFVQPENINDIQAYELASQMAKKIEAELAYPGEVRVTVIRETRVVEYAR
jgi:ribonuclease Y